MSNAIDTDNNNSNNINTPIGKSADNIINNNSTFKANNITYIPTCKQKSLNTCKDKSILNKQKWLVVIYLLNP